LAVAELDIGAEAAGAQRHIEAGLRILAELLVRLNAAFAAGRERTGVAALRIIRAADEGAELAELERQAAVAAHGALARIAAVGARWEDVRRQHVVEDIDDLADLQVLDLADRAREVAPEIAQQVAPFHLVVGDAVELVLQPGGEVVLDVAREEVLQERDDDAAAVLGNEAALVDAHVFAVLEHLQDRRVGRWPADAELLH